MLSLFKRASRLITAPCAGETVSLQEVGDAVFAEGLAGEGVAIKPIEGLFCAPIDGVVQTFFETRHAFVIAHKNDYGVMIHIGIDTVELGGEGFEALVKEGDKVQAGEPIVKVDLELLQARGKETITPILLTEASRYKKLDRFLGIVKTGDKVMELK